MILLDRPHLDLVEIDDNHPTHFILHIQLSHLPTKPATTTTHKSRKFTVLPGGIIKKSLLPSTHTKKEEYTILTLVSASVAAANKTAMTKHARNTSVASSISSA
jgi:hypothetical protein